MAETCRHVSLRRTLGSRVARLLRDVRWQARLRPTAGSRALVGIDCSVLHEASLQRLLASPKYCMLMALNWVPVSMRLPHASASCHMPLRRVPLRRVTSLHDVSKALSVRPKSLLCVSIPHIAWHA